MPGQPTFSINLNSYDQIYYPMILSILFHFMFGHIAYSCPLCPPVSASLTEQFEQSSIVILAEWNSNLVIDETSLTEFIPIKIVKGDKDYLESRQVIQTEGDYQGTKGDLFLLFRGKGNEENWTEIFPVSETSYQYILQAPGLESDKKIRLAYFLRFLEFPDSLIANDAFTEFAQASFEDVSSLVKKYPVDKLRQWVNDAKTPVTRIGLYSLMLGLSGQKQDAEIFKNRMKNLNNEFHLGLDGLMAGYVLITGNQGLEYINKNYLSRKDASSSESFAAMKALRFLHQYAKNHVDSIQVEASMRLLLMRSSMTELVIIDLTRWKDWSIANQLMEIYSQPEHDNRPTRRAIIVYLLLFQEEKNHVNKVSDNLKMKVTVFLEQAEKKYPKVYRQAERLLNR